MEFHFHCKGKLLLHAYISIATLFGTASLQSHYFCERIFYCKAHVLYVSKLCKKGCSKLFARARISGYKDSNKARILTIAFVISQCQYCPLVSMFHCRHLNNKIDRILERALRIAYKDFESSFNTLLENDDLVSIHAKKLQTLPIEMFKTRNISPPFRREIFF